jgi:hypothetical protein
VAVKEHEHSGSAIPKKGRRNQASLDICVDAFSDEAIQALLNDWLVPMIVDELVHGLLETRQHAS